MADAASNQEVVNIGVKELLEAGMHFGHQSKRWNPKMKRFIFGKRNGIYIIDLTKTLSQLKLAQQFVYEVASQGRGILFVGTKKQCQEAIKEAAARCGQHYINSRWLGGTLTNHRNIRISIKRMQMIEDMEKKGVMDNMPQKEVSRLRHELARLQRFLSGLSNLNSMPGAIVIIDVNRESIAVKEANRMGIPIVATVDTNCDPDPISYPIPGNDDSSRAVRLVLNVMADAIIQASAEYAAGAAQRQADAEAQAQEQAARRESATTDTDQETPHRGRRSERSERGGGDRRPRRGGRSDQRAGGTGRNTAKSVPAARKEPAPADDKATPSEPAAVPAPAESPAG